MKKVLQHSETRLYLTRSGKYTAKQTGAASWPSITAATKFCAFIQVDLTKFVYRSVSV